MEIHRLTLREWEEALPQAGFGVFHTPTALSVLENHVDGELRLYGGFQGGQPVCLFPVFLLETKLAQAVVSPPPGFAVPHLGPVCVSPCRHRGERVADISAFVDGLIDRLDVQSPLTVFRAVLLPQSPVPQFLFGPTLELSTGFTYRLPIGDDADDLLNSFSKSLRREIRDAQRLDLTARVEDIEGSREVFESTRDRYRDQNVSFSLKWDYVRELLERLTIENRERTYIVRDPTGRFLSGIITLYSNDVAYYWLGGARASYDDVSINSLLHWNVITDLMTDSPNDSLWGYDLMGANTERICRYKSKFDGCLVPYHRLESRGIGMGVAKSAYRALHR